MNDLASMWQVMGPPFVACMILVAIHSYLGLHVIAREVIFVDLSLAQMAALGTTAGLLLGVDPGSTSSQLMAFAFVVIGAAMFAATRTSGTTALASAGPWDARRYRASMP
jgi:zinc/manganese transport system permease protein